MAVFRGLFRYLIFAGFLLLPACRENLFVPTVPTGPQDTMGPGLQVFPGHDTVVDSTGTLIVRVRATDISGVKEVDFDLTPPTVNFTPTAGHDTVVDVLFPIPLSAYKHSVFHYTAQGVDVLDHQAVSTTVTVTVK